jgi:hypothetical protein
MCMISVVTTYGQELWPIPVQQGIYTPPETTVTVAETETKLPTPEQWAYFLELMEKAKKFDEMADQADCIDPEKARWQADIEKRLKDLEEDKSAKVANALFGNSQGRNVNG